MAKVFRYLFIALVIIGALGKEVVQKYYSSPAPDPRLGRTVESFGTSGNTIYVTPRIDRFFWVLIALCAVTFGGGLFWPADKKATQPVPSSPVSRPTTPTTLTYDWYRLKKGGLFVFPAATFALTTYVWISERNNPGWMPRIIFSAIALWTLTMLVEYRTRIDTVAGLFTREKLLFGRYHVGALKIPLSEFTAVVLDRYVDTEDSKITFYVCLKHRSGSLRQVCYFEPRAGQGREDADNTAQEIAAATQLPYEEVV